MFVRIVLLTIPDVCKLLFPNKSTYHISLQRVIPLSPMYTKQYHKAIKLFAWVSKLQAPPIRRARAPVSALLWKWVINCVLESMEFKMLQLKNSLHPRRTSSLGSGLEPYWFQLKIIQVIVTIRSNFSVFDT